MNMKELTGAQFALTNDIASEQILRLNGFLRLFEGTLSELKFRQKQEINLSSGFNPEGIFSLNV